MQILIPQLEPLTEQQLLAVCNLQQSSQQAEEALSQGMEALQQNLADTLASPGTAGSSSNVASYMAQMAMAMGKLGTLENFVRQVSINFPSWLSMYICIALGYTYSLFSCIGFIIGIYIVLFLFVWYKVCRSLKSTTSNE